MNLIGIKEAAKMLDVPTSFLYSRTRTGTIEHYKVGKYIKFSPEQLERFLEGKRRGTERDDFLDR